MLHCQRTANFALVCNRMSGESIVHYFKGIYFFLTVLFCLLSGKTPKHKICCSFVLWDFKELSTVCVCVCVCVCKGLSVPNVGRTELQRDSSLWP